MKISIIIPTYLRDNLLKYSLESLSKQIISNLEVFVVNDGLPGECENLCKKYEFNYIFTGERNLKKLQWRSGVISINTGVKTTKGEIIIISCGEMYYINNNCLDLLVQPVIKNSMAIGIPVGKDDDGKYLALLDSNQIDLNNQLWSVTRKLNTTKPFLMAIRKEHFVEIGGYDENFLVGGDDDTDIRDRLLAYGCFLVKTKAKCIHLWHKRDHGGIGSRENKKSKRYYLSMKGQIYRNGTTPSNKLLIG